MTRMKIDLRGLVVALALGMGVASAADASPIQATYSTVGTIGTTGITGTPDVSFQGVSNATLTTGQPFDLGQFVVTTPPGGGTTTYGTPFQITLTVTNASGDPALASATPIDIKGYLESELIGGKWTTVAGFNFTGTPRVGAPPQEALSYWISEGGHIAYQLYPTSLLEPPLSDQPERRGFRRAGRAGPQKRARADGAGAASRRLARVSSSSTVSPGFGAHDGALSQTCLPRPCREGGRGRPSIKSPSKPVDRRPGGPRRTRGPTAPY